MRGLGTSTTKRRPLAHYLALATAIVLLATAAYTTLFQPQGSSFARVRFGTPHTMENIETPFTIELNGSPVSKLSNAAIDEPVHAKVGQDAAVFTLKDGQLQCGGMVLGRNLTEQRSMLPKPVFWFKEGTAKDRIRPVTAHQDGNSYKLEFGGAPLMEQDGAVFADLMREGESTVSVKVQ